MIDVTEIILNFQKLLVAIAKSLSTIGLYKGSDEWEELTESAFNTLVVNHLTEKLDFSMSHQYELWDRDNKDIVVQIGVGVPVLIGEREVSSERKYRYEDIAKSASIIEFSFVEFGNPSFAEEDSAGLEYAVGLDKHGRVVCAKKEDCKFFVSI